MFKNGDRVEWKEGGWKQDTCTGKILCKVTFTNGSHNGWYTIVVDQGKPYHKACHTATEMNLGWVDRNVDINKITLLTSE